MSKNASYRASRSGTWQPYVPQVGVSTGCRTGTRNEGEAYRILHLSQRFEDSRLKDNAESRPVPAAAKSSFSGSSTVPQTDEISSLNQGVTQKTFSGSLGIGLIPTVQTGDAVSRLHSGKISEQTFSLNEADASVELQLPRRRNNETLVPPDNISIGLVPIEEFSFDPKINVRRFGNTSTTSLGPGLVPISKSTDSSAPIVKLIPPAQSVGFERVYGRNAFVPND